MDPTSISIHIVWYTKNSCFKNFFLSPSKEFIFTDCVYDPALHKKNESGSFLWKVTLLDLQEVEDTKCWKIYLLRNPTNIRHFFVLWGATRGKNCDGGVAIVLNDKSSDGVDSGLEPSATSNLRFSLVHDSLFQYPIS